MEADHLHRELADLGFYIRTVVKIKSPESQDDMPLFLVVCSDTVENRRACPPPPTEKPTRALCGGAHVASYRGREVWKRAIARQRGQTPAPRPKKPATRRPGVSFAAAASGAATGAAPSLPTASDAPDPAASEGVPTPEATAPPQQPTVAEPITASPTTSTRPRPANRRRDGRRPVGPQRSATQSSSSRWTLTAKQPRLPLPATGPRLLLQPPTWPTSSRSSPPA
ncbi:translation initiation factor IF-2-like [Schistocerca nitens]|uniref:translation initiation factor IF-2-like n=1 Tax=Schistocerca nitens TaxID=7011 RepID=UPI002117A7BF|nr:translation initiation factor IF-2-like [Schistocerca nitens]